MSTSLHLPPAPEGSAWSLTLRGSWLLLEALTDAGTRVTAFQMSPEASNAEICRAARKHMRRWRRDERLYAMLEQVEGRYGAEHQDAGAMGLPPLPEGQWWLIERNTWGPKSTFVELVGHKGTGHHGLGYKTEIRTTTSAKRIARAARRILSTQDRYAARAQANARKQKQQRARAAANRAQREAAAKANAHRFQPQDPKEDDRA